MKTETITIGAREVVLEVAVTAIEQRTGLMHRAHLPENNGMIFYFDTPRKVSMWMKNTLIDLDAAFVDPCGMIVHIATMKAGSLDLHNSRKEVSTVIEMNAGWFERNGISAGYMLDGIVQKNFCGPDNTPITSNR